MWENIALQAKSLFPMPAKEMCANSVRGAVASLIPLCWGGLQGLPQRGDQCIISAGEARKWRYQSTKEHTSMHCKTEWSEAIERAERTALAATVDCCFAAVYHLGFADACVRTRGNGSN